MSDTIAAKEAAKLWGITERRVTVLCKEMDRRCIIEKTNILWFFYGYFLCGQGKYFQRTKQFKSELHMDNQY